MRATDILNGMGELVAQNLPRKTMATYEELKTLCDSGSDFGLLRKSIRSALAPAIPYLGTLEDSEKEHHVTDGSKTFRPVSQRLDVHRRR